MFVLVRKLSLTVLPAKRKRFTLSSIQPSSPALCVAASVWLLMAARCFPVSSVSQRERRALAAIRRSSR